MEIVEDTGCSFPNSSLLVCLALRSIQPLLPYTGSHGLCRLSGGVLSAVSFRRHSLYVLPILHGTFS